jgi:hypothetical protein
MMSPPSNAAAVCCISSSKSGGRSKTFGWGVAPLSTAMGEPAGGGGISSSDCSCGAALGTPPPPDEDAPEARAALPGMAAVCPHLVFFGKLVESCKEGYSAGDPPAAASWGRGPTKGRAAPSQAQGLGGVAPLDPAPPAAGRAAGAAEAEGPPFVFGAMARRAERQGVRKQLRRGHTGERSKGPRL